MTTLLVIDDDRLHCDLLQLTFARQGYQVSTATSGQEGLALFRRLHPSVTLLDLRMPQMDGLAVLKEIRAHDPSAGVIILGGGATEEQENKARELRVTDFFRKGLSLDILIGAVQRVAQYAKRQASVLLPTSVDRAEEGLDEQILVVDDDVMARTSGVGAAGDIDRAATPDIGGAILGIPGEEFEPVRHWLNDNSNHLDRCGVGV